MKIVLISIALSISIIVLSESTTAQSHTSYGEAKVPCMQSIQWLMTHPDTCVRDFPDGECKLQEFGRIGKINEQSYFYGIYKTNWVCDDTSLGTYGILSIHIFKSAQDTLFALPVLEEVADDATDRIETPEFIATEYGIILHIFMTGGNGGFDFGAYFLHHNDSWQRLALPEWHTAFEKNVPRGSWFCRGPRVDLVKMKTYMNVFKADDACCCPTGGSICAELVITGHSIRIRSVKYSSEKYKDEE